jgi:DNA repair exonuclease SbcCD nuclease subunit
MVTLLWRTDVHLSDHTPVSRTDDWATTVLEKLEQVGAIAKRLGAAAVLDGGDFFDIKSPGRTSHQLIRRVAAVHAKYPCPVYANVGNHDCVYGDYAFLPQQPLGVLYETGVFRRLYDENELWLRGANDVTVRVVGIPYHGTRYDMERFRRITRGRETYLVVVAHMLASPTETTLFDGEDVVRYDALDRYPVDVYCFGHWHQDQGIARTPGGRWVVNTGSLTRGSLAQEDLKRVPSVVAIHAGTKQISLEKIPLRYAPADQVFDLVARDAQNLREELMEQFVAKLQAIVLPDRRTSLRDAVLALPEEEVSAPVRELLLHYTDQAGGR